MKKVWRFAEEDDWSAEQSRGNADEGASLNFVRGTVGPLSADRGRGRWEGGPSKPHKD